VCREDRRDRFVVVVSQLGRERARKVGRGGRECWKEIFGESLACWQRRMVVQGSLENPCRAGGIEESGRFEEPPLPLDLRQNVILGIIRFGQYDHLSSASAN
jgi:hypothetical protein